MKGLPRIPVNGAANCKNLKKHKESCAFQEVQCPLENCPTKIQRRELNNHIQTCTYKIITCKDCQLELRQWDLQQHDNDCPDALIPCPNNCGNNEDDGIIKRSDIIYHLDHACGKATVDCPFAEQGCSIKILHKEVEKHLQDMMPSHMLLLAKQNTQLIKENSLLAKQNDTLRNELTDIKENVRILNDSLEQAKKNLQDQLSSTNSYTWTIHDYPAIAKKYSTGSSFKSPTFWLCGYELKLSMHPNGDKSTPGHTSLCLYVVNDQYGSKTPGNAVVPNSEITIFFRLSIVSQKPGVSNVWRQTSGLFNKNTTNRGWSRFIAKNDVISLCSNNGNLKIKA